ncbi:TetR/AcrR family transcriptional regulator [Amycolatopsis rubida]|uniref:TetR/AcrR family transcriptional regulator n=1 Tax=Amycolatopsis rubida TaxID=112413 RepID=A0ABX0BL53_9PSEU|nr:MULTISPECIES: TetR/AcrR family transcriptional regulator [Amycolatopsis]MYW91056.1 TetR family transcriptional regulator [Amycolatopsis rubida]NEC56041.1 TetR/AcrR family transcriptional regulator [Amycolatopsis rubida]OAP22146.1 DNA-binding transcriptional repressor AcrR [Amycolatopsis sp. M39]
MATGSKPLRADAARNRGKLLAAATRAFGEHGLDAPLEQIARSAGVSIGTLYAHFPTRDAFVDAILPAQIAALDDLAAKALAEPDPWQGFTGFLDGLFALQAKDHGLSDALARRLPLSPAVREACRTGFEHAERIIDRAKESGQLRADFEPADLAPLVAAMSQLIRESPETWRRHLAFFVDGLRGS